MFVTVFANRSTVPRQIRNHDKADSSYTITQLFLPGLIS